MQLLQSDFFLAALFSTLFLFLVEILYFKYLKNKETAREFAHCVFNWRFLLSRPFSLYAIPLLAIFSLEVFVTPGMDVVIFIAVYAIFAQVFVEEIIFRGMLLGGLLRKYCSPAPKVGLRLAGLVLLQALVFSALHITTKNPIGVFAGGVAYGILFVAAKNDVALPTIAHAATNIAIFLGAVIPLAA